MGQTCVCSLGITLGSERTSGQELGGKGRGVVAQPLFWGPSAGALVRRLVQGGAALEGTTPPQPAEPASFFLMSRFIISLIFNRGGWLIFLKNY